MLATRGRQDGITYIRSYTKTADNIFMWDTKMIDCKVGLSQDAEFAGDLADSISTSGGLLCLFCEDTIVPVSRACKKDKEQYRTAAQKLR